MSSDYLYLGEDNLVWFRQPIDEVDGTAITTGTATYALKNAAGTSLATGSLTYISSGTNAGDWYGVIDKDAPSTALVEGTTYYVELTIASSGRDAFRRLARKAKYHGNV
jgi:hypothetical protein